MPPSRSLVRQPVATWRSRGSGTASGSSKGTNRDASGSTEERWTLGVVGLALAVAAGVVLRVAVLLSSLGRPDSDEVIAGLMARRLFSDGLPAFFWGQPYGGTIELLPVAASLQLFGTSVPALRIPTILLGAVNALLVWRVGCRLVSRGRAQVAGLLAWIWPAAGVWFGVREQLFYVPTVTIGLLALLVALRLASGAGGGKVRSAWPEWVALGALLGVGWWTSPNIIYFLPPVAVALIARPGGAPSFDRTPWSGLVLSAGAAVLGALPWLVTNVGSGLPSLHATDGFPGTGTYPERFWWFFTDGLPAEMGFRAIGDLRWVGGPIGVVAYVFSIVGLGVAVGLIGRAGARRGVVRWVPRPDVAGLLAFPFLLALIPFAMAQPNLRYLFFLAPFLCLLLARLVTGRATATVLLTAAVLVTAVGLAGLRDLSEAPGTAFRVGSVGDLGPAIDALDDAGVTAVYADYWVAYRLVYESDERIVAVPSAGTHRSSDYLAEVSASPVVGWVVSAGGQKEALATRLDAIGVSYRSVVAGEMVVVLTDRPVTPHELPNGARAPEGAELSPPPGESY